MIENDISHTFTDTVRKKFIELGFPKATSGQLSKIILPFKVDPIEKKVFARCDNFFYLEQIVKPYHEEIHDIVKKCWGESFVFEIDNSASEPLQSTPSEPTSIERVINQQIVQKSTAIESRHHEQKNDLKSPAFKESKYDFGNFIAIEKNLDALNACQYVVKNFQHGFTKPIILYGETGTGKTHLLHAIENAFTSQNKHIKILHICIHDFINEIIHKGIRLGAMDDIRKKYNSCDVLLVDDIQSLEKKTVCQTEFLHIMANLLQKNKQLVMTTNKHPKDYKNIDQRLKSRFLQSAIIQTSVPETSARFQIIKQKIKNLNISLSDDSIALLANTLECNVHEIEGALNEIAFKTKVFNNKLTKTHIATIIDNRRPQQQNCNVPIRKISLSELNEMICQYFGLDLTELTGRQRQKKVVSARHLAIYFAKTYLELSSTVIANHFGRKHHKIVSYAVKKITSDSHVHVEMKEHLKYLQHHLESKR